MLIVVAYPNESSFPLVVMACNGVATVEKFAMNFLKY
jgi:hypothetical protein